MSVTSFDSTIASNLGRCVGPKYKIFSSRPTPGTGSSSSRSLRSYTLISLYEGSGQFKGTIGMAITDLRYPEVYLYQFIDSNAYLRLTTKIQVEDPIEVIVADSINERKNTLLLIEATKSAAEDATITMVHKRYFCETRGADLVKQLSNAEISDCDQVIQDKKRFAMAACGGLLKYIEFIQNVMFGERSLKICYKDVEKICMIDMSSWKCLELIDNAEMSVTKKIRRSLLSAIDYTLTPSGFRLLRSNLLQPLADEAALEKRYDAVEELLDSPHLLERIREILTHVHELDNILALCVKATAEPTIAECEANVGQLQKLRKTLDVVAPLKKCLENVKSELLKGMKDKLCDGRIDQIIGILDVSLDTGCLAMTKKNSLNLRNQKCYAVKAGICVNLDVARKTYEELLIDLNEGHVMRDIEEHLPKQNTRLAFSISRGFHYVWVTPKAGSACLPSMFLNEVRNRSSISFTSKSLLRYNDRINECVAEIMITSNNVINSLIDQIRDLIPVLYHIMESTYTLDFFACLAIYSSNTECCRPVLGNSLLFREGRHPLLNFHLKADCTPNDTYLSPEAHFGIITGPNMGGKSTYLRQVCQLSILAQVGCLVPAEVAVIPVFNHIFSRVGHNDNISKGLSAFALEMSEMAVIMHYADAKSLIVIDELARSTSTEEGIGISYAIAEYLIDKQAFVFLATHFLDLVSLDEKYTVVENYHFTTQTQIEDNDNEVFRANHKLFKGPYNGPLYGFELVELSTFPTEVIDNARELAHKLKAENEKKGRISFEAAKKKLLVRTALKLRQALVLKETSTDEVMIDHLSNIRKSYEKKLVELQKSYEEDDDDDDPPVGESVSEDAF